MVIRSGSIRMADRHENREQGSGDTDHSRTLMEKKRKYI